MFPASKLWRRLLLAAGLVAVYTLVGFFLLPVIAKSQLEKRLSALLGRRVTVEKVRVNPYVLAVTLENFAIHEPDGTTRFAGWRRLYVNVDVLAPLWREWTVREVTLDGFAAGLALRPDATPNFSDILSRLSAESGPTPPPPESGRPGRPVHVGKLTVIDARIDFSDASTRQPFRTAIGPVTFTLTDFRTLGARGAPYHFEAVSEAGEQFTWTGTLQAEPLQSSGRFSLQGISLPKYAPYHAHHTQADVTGGTLSMQGTYDFSLAKDRRTVALRDGSVQVRGLVLQERATRQTAVELPALDVTGIHADALAMKAKVDAVTLTGGKVRVRREKDGNINLLAMLQPDPAAAAPSAPRPPPPASAAPAPRPDVTVGEVAIKGFNVEVADLSLPRPAHLALNDVNVSVQKVTLAENADMPVTFTANWAPQGSLTLGGKVSVFPLKADLDLGVNGLALGPVSPYLEQFVQARLTEGVLTLALKAQAELPAGQPPAVTVSGDVQLEKFGLVDGVHNEPLAGVRSFALRGLRASTAPTLTVALDEVAIDGPSAHVTMAADKTLNLAGLVRSGPPSAPTAPTATATAPAAAPAPEPRIEIAKVTISEGDFRFTDRSLQPNVATALNHFGGSIAGLSSTNPAKADLNLKGTVDGAGPVAIVGKIDPLGAAKSVDLKVDFRNVDLVPLSPYSGKYAGYELARGKLGLDVKVKVDGPAIDSANVITLNQFTFGSPVKSPEATGLPVRLGVALLKDLEGKIVIDVPVQGRTDDPSFKVGRVVLRVIVNLLTKAAVSPFSLLGSAFGGGGDELAYQEFVPGSSALNPAEVKKLETMVKALTNRPALNVDLQGSYDPAADAFALKRVKLDELVRRTAWEARRQRDANVPPPEQITLTPEETAATIKALYDAKFPPGTEFGTPLPKPPDVVNPPPPPTGFFRRIMNAVTQQSARQKRAADAENARRSAEHEKAVAAAQAAGIPFEEMSGRLAESLAVDENDLRALAQARTQQVRDYFTGVGKIDPERVFLAKDQADAARQAKGPRVFLGLQ